MSAAQNAADLLHLALKTACIARIMNTTTMKIITPLHSFSFALLPHSHRSYFISTPRRPLHTLTSTASTRRFKHPCKSPQFADYKFSIPVNIIIKLSTHSFRFGTGIHRSTGSFMARLPIPNHYFLTFKRYIVPIDIRVMIGMVVLEQFGVRIESFIHHLTSRSQKWHLPHKLQHNQAYILYEHISFSTCYSKTELLKMNKNFMHPSHGKLLHIIKGAKI